MIKGLFRHLGGVHAAQCPEHFHAVEQHLTHTHTHTYIHTHIHTHSFPHIKTQPGVIKVDIVLVLAALVSKDQKRKIITLETIVRGMFDMSLTRF